MLSQTQWKAYIPTPRWRNPWAQQPKSVSQRSSDLMMPALNSLTYCEKLLGSVLECRMGDPARQAPSALTSSIHLPDSREGNLSFRAKRGISLKRGAGLRACHSNPSVIALYCHIRLCSGLSKSQAGTPKPQFNMIPPPRGERHATSISLNPFGQSLKLLAH